MNRRNILKATALSPLALLPVTQVKAAESVEQKWADYIEKEFIKNLSGKNPVLQTLHGVQIFYDTAMHFDKNKSGFYGWITVSIKKMDIEYFNKNDKDLLQYYGLNPEDSDKIVSFVNDFGQSTDYGYSIEFPFLFTEEQIDNILKMLWSKAGFNYFSTSGLPSAISYRKMLSERKGKYGDGKTKNIQVL
jgi:hypothetical protein